MTTGAAETAPDVLPDDADSRAVVTAWPNLAEPIRAAILAMIRAVR